MLAAFAKTTIRIHSWEGERPVAGDFLRTRTGRQYEIKEVRWPSLRVAVLPAGAICPATQSCHPFYWMPRGKRSKKCLH